MNMLMKDEVSLGELASLLQFTDERDASVAGVLELVKISRLVS